MTTSIALIRADGATARAHAEGRHAWWLYVEEILGHQRTPFFWCEPDGLTAATTTAVVSTTENLDHTAAERLHEWTEQGGTLLIVGAPGTLGERFGLDIVTTLGDSHVTFASNEIWTQRPPVALHALGGVGYRLESGTDSLGTWADGSVAIIRRSVGNGVLLALGPDLWQSVVRIQQGFPVHADGEPAQDGTAPIDDGLLKAEDGMALSLEDDRAIPPGEPELGDDYEHTYPPPSAVPVFHEPHADHWRSVLHQLLWESTASRGKVLPWLSYWPAGIPAIAHMSHDADINDVEDGLAALVAFAEADVKVTWCQVHPGGYGRDLHRAITLAGHENALHYNAMDDSDLATWGWPQMRAQYAWAQAVTGEEDIVSNKNHYIRWEGWTEFYSWCEQLGIKIDQSRGPSKQGTVGFPFGTAHVTFPMGDLDAGNRLMNVLNLPLHTQDLAWAGHVAVRDVVLEAALAHHGVAHFLYHGPHLRKRPLTRASCLEVAGLARERGMQWWTSREINSWERARRTVDVDVEQREGSWHVRARSGAHLTQAAILLPVPDGSVVEEFELDGRGSLDTVVRHGRQFLELAVDLEPGVLAWTVRIGASPAGR